jgi:acyl carrier protein
LARAISIGAGARGSPPPLKLIAVDLVETIVDILKRLISNVLRIDENSITPKTAIHATPRWDSLKHIELVVAIETTFRIELTEDEIVAMRSVGKIQEILQKRGVLPV